MPANWSQGKKDVKACVVQEGFLYLDGQLRLATSSDQRASVLAGVFTTAATAVLAGVVAFSTSNGVENSAKLAIYVGGSLTVLMFFLASSFAIAAILPVAFWLPGNQPSSWYDDVNSGRELEDAHGEEAEHIQDKIDYNRTVLKKNASRFKWAAILGIAAPIIGFVFWLLTSCLLWLCHSWAS